MMKHTDYNGRPISGIWHDEWNHLEEIARKRQARRETLRWIAVYAMAGAAAAVILFTSLVADLPEVPA